MTPGRAIYWIRMSLGETRKEFGEGIGISEFRIGELEVGSDKPDHDEFTWALCRADDIPAHFLYAARGIRALKKQLKSRAMTEEGK